MTIKTNRFIMNKIKKNLYAYLFVLPLLTLLCIFFVYGIGFMIKTSFFKVDLAFLTWKPVGLKNYIIAINDIRLFKALLNTVIFALGAIVISMTMGFVYSVFLCLDLRFSRFYRTIFFIPTLLPNALIAAVFAGVFQSRYGTLNKVLGKLGLDFLQQNWLSDPFWAYTIVLSISVYLIGMPMMYYTADLSAISKSVFEAAIIDGVNMRQMITKIIHPLMRNANKTVILTMLLGSFRGFERVYLLTQGGPGYTTEITGTYIYSFFGQGGAVNMGYVSTISGIVLLVAFTLGLLQLRFSRQTS